MCAGVRAPDGDRLGELSPARAFALGLGLSSGLMGGEVLKGKEQVR